MKVRILTLLSITYNNIYLLVKFPHKTIVFVFQLLCFYSLITALLQCKNNSFKPHLQNLSVPPTFAINRDLSLFYLSLQKKNGQSVTTLAGKIKQNCLFGHIKPQRQNIIMTFTRLSYKRQQFSIGL